jgi:hypothetical protein
MTSVAFDTLTMAKRLEAAGFNKKQAEAVTGIMNEATDPASRDIVSNKDLQIELAPVRADLGLIKWMCGVNSALIIGVLLKLFLT